MLRLLLRCSGTDGLLPAQGTSSGLETSQVSLNNPQGSLKQRGQNKGLALFCQSRP